MSLYEKLVTKGMGPFRQVRYRDGLAPAHLTGTVFEICYPFPNKGKLNLLRHGGTASQSSHSDWHGKFEVVKS